MVKKTKKLDIPLSGYDLKHLFSSMEERPNIVLENDIKNTWTADDIFKGSGHATIFREYPNEAVGHWYVVTRHHKPTKSGYEKDGSVLIFDSLGGKPKKAVVDVLLKSYPKVLWNEIPYQKDEENSCGRWALAIASLNKLGLSPYEIEDLLKNTKNINEFIINTFRK